MKQSARVEVRLGARRVTRAFGSVLANDRVDLSVAPATIHAVVGGNGAGKSTLMRILQGVDHPDEGSVILDDHPVRLAGPADAYARGIGMVHQEFMLAPPLTLLENSGSCPRARRIRRSDRLARRPNGGRPTRQDCGRHDRLAPARRRRSRARAPGARNSAIALSRSRRAHP